MENSMWRLPAMFNEVFLDPIGIVQEQCEELQKLSEGKLTAQIQEYSEGLRWSSLFGQKPSMSQSELGEFERNEEGSGIVVTQNKGPRKYEFFISSSEIPRYKYRAFFLSIPAFGYPVTFVIEQDIVDELGLRNEKYVCDSVERFTTMLAKILGSQRIVSILRGLLSYQS